MIISSLSLLSTGEKTNPNPQADPESSREGEVYSLALH